MDVLLEAAVAALPEFYQPIFGHIEQWPASRETEDRVRAILPVIEAFQALHGRAPRILDIGCAQGYVSLRLAEKGATVLGIDLDPRNIHVCALLAERHPHLPVRFEAADALGILKALPAGEFDIVLGLSVLHHVCHRIGFAATRDLLAGLSRQVPILLVELAVREEPLYWAASLPEDPYAFVEDFQFIREIGQFATHLSPVPRPLLFCSNRVALLDETLFCIETIRTQSVVGIGEGEQAGQAYIEAGPEFLKHVTFRCLNWEAKRAELAREAAYLTGPDRAVDDPVLFTHVDTGREAWLRRSRIPGETLDIVKSRREPVDAVRITRDVLKQLARLESRGWYHADLSLWNIVLTPEGDARLIDFGALTRDPANCVWPTDLRLAFVQFLFDMTGDAPLRAYPVRRPRIRPSHLPFPFRDATRAMLAEMPHWSAQDMLDRLETAIARGPSTGSEMADGLIATALDEHLDRLGDTVEAVRKGFVRQRDGLNALFHWRGGIEAAHHQTRQQAEALETRLAGLEGAHHATWMALTALDARVKGLEQAHHEDRARLEALERRPMIRLPAWLSRRIGR